MFSINFSKEVAPPPLTAAAAELASETAPSEPKKRNSAVLTKQDPPAAANEKKADTSSVNPCPSSFQDSFEDKDGYFDEEEDKKDQPSLGLPAPQNTRIKRPPLLGRVDSQYINYEILTNEGVDEHVKRYQGHDSWRYKIVKFIHSKKVQYILMSLLLLDVIILFVEMFLLATFPMCNLIERDGLSCCPGPKIASSSSLASPLQHDDDFVPTRFLLGDDDICPDGTLEFAKASCDSHKWHDVHVAEGVFSSLTILILSTFFVELNIEMIAVSPCVFFRQVFLLFDYIIVTISLGLEITFLSMNDLHLQSAVGLIILARLWRFVRIAHGIVEVVTELSSSKYQDLLAYAESLEVTLKENDIAVPDIPSIRKLKLHDENIISEIEFEHRSHHFKKHQLGSGQHSSSEE